MTKFQVWLVVCNWKKRYNFYRKRGKNNGFRKKIRTTSVEIIREYYDPIIVDDTVYDAYSGGFLNKDLLYLFSDEYTQNEKYVTFDLQFRAFLEEYIYVYEKFELIA